MTTAQPGLSAILLGFVLSCSYIPGSHAQSPQKPTRNTEPCRATSDFIPAQESCSKPRLNASPGEAESANRIKEDDARLLGILATDPENAGALAGMGWVRSRQKNYLGAISYLERAKQQRPNDHSLLLALDLARFRAILTEAQKSLESDEISSAQKFFSLALQIRPHNQEALAGIHAASLKARGAVSTRHP